MQTLNTPNRWDVWLRDGHIIALWADCFSVEGDDYVFSTLVRATVEEQRELQIDGRTPSDPEVVSVVNARIPVALVEEPLTAHSPDGPSDHALLVPNIAGKTITEILLLGFFWSKDSEHWDSKAPSDPGGLQIAFNDTEVVVLAAKAMSGMWHSSRPWTDLFHIPEGYRHGRWEAIDASNDEPYSGLIGQTVREAREKRDSQRKLIALEIVTEDRMLRLTQADEGEPIVTVERL